MAWITHRLDFRVARTDNSRARGHYVMLGEPYDPFFLFVLTGYLMLGSRWESW